MQLLHVVVLCTVLALTQGGWLHNFVSPKGLDVGNGLKLQLHDSKKLNDTLMERLALIADFRGYSVNVAKAPTREAVQVGFFVNGEEGRGKKDQQSMMVMLIGYKMATVLTVTLAVLGAVTFQALGMAKLALFTSALVFVSKLFHHEPQQHHRAPAYVEIEALPEHHALPETSSSGDEYHPSASTNYYGYSNYVPSGAASDTLTNYGTIEPSGGNATATGNQQVVAGTVARRRDVARRKTAVPVLTVHRYTIQS